MSPRQAVRWAVRLTCRCDPRPVGAALCRLQTKSRRCPAPERLRQVMRERGGACCHSATAHTALASRPPSLCRSCICRALQCARRHRPQRRPLCEPVEHASIRTSMALLTPSEHHHHGPHPTPRPPLGLTGLRPTCRRSQPSAPRAARMAHVRAASSRGTPRTRRPWNRARTAAGTATVKVT